MRRGSRQARFGAAFGGSNVTDEKLQSLTDEQLRTLHGSAPGYLTFLLDRKRILEQGILWEMSIPQRAAKNQGSHERTVPTRVFRGSLQAENLADQDLHALTEKQLTELYSFAPGYLTFLLDRKRTLEQGILWEMNIPQRGASSAR
jgi:tRNA A37 threonylcarbamoyladenosine synthetase subunit TsaC/SUA5/YrdC